MNIGYLIYSLKTNNKFIFSSINHNNIGSYYISVYILFKIKLFSLEFSIFSVLKVEKITYK